MSSTNCDQLRKLRRLMVETNLGLGRILDYYGLPRATEEEVDAALRERGVPVGPASPRGATGRSRRG